MTLRETLFSMVDSGRVPHAIMLHEDDGGGALGIALDFLCHLYGDDGKVRRIIHPDVHFLFPVGSKHLSEDFLEEWRSLVTANPGFTENDLYEALGADGKSALIAVPEAKALLETMGLSALEGGYRSAVIYLPEKMNAEAANRLLKLVEEPPSLTQFVFITHFPEKVLQTIRSRCQVIRVIPESVTGFSARFEEFPALMSALASRDLAAALDVAESIASMPSKESSKAFCKFACECLRRMFLIQQDMASLVGDDAEAAGWAGSFKKTFPRAAMSDFNRAAMLIDRNVNPKILFTDLVDRLYLHL